MSDFDVWRSPNIIVIVCPSAMIIFRDIHTITTWFACCPIKMRLQTSRMFIVQMYRRNNRDVTLDSGIRPAKCGEFATFSIDIRVKQAK